MAIPPRLEASDVAKRFGATLPVDDVALDIAVRGRSAANAGQYLR